jgi:PAS domain S-box-containing protein
LPIDVNPIHDPARLAVLYHTSLLGSAPDVAFDRFTRLTAKLLNVPVALVSLVDTDHQFFKSCVGLPEPLASNRQTPLSHSFCKYVVASKAPLQVDDARIHSLVRNNLAVPDFGVIAYLGSPLVTSQGHVMGALCAIDSKPRKWSRDQLGMIEDLAAFVATEIEVRLAQFDALEMQKAIQAAEEARRLELHMRSLADTMPQIVWTSDLDGNVNYYNQRWFEYTGLTFEQTKNSGWSEAVHPDDLQRTIDQNTQQQKSGIALDIELRLKRGGDGEYRWHLARSVPMRNQAGEIVQWVGTSTDIHDKKLAEAALQQSRDELERRVNQPSTKHNSCRAA